DLGTCTRRFRVRFRYLIPSELRGVESDLRIVAGTLEVDAYAGRFASRLLRLSACLFDFDFGFLDFGLRHAADRLQLLMCLRAKILERLSHFADLSFGGALDVFRMFLRGASNLCNLRFGLTPNRFRGGSHRAPALFVRGPDELFGEGLEVALEVLTQAGGRAV